MNLNVYITNNNPIKIKYKIIIIIKKKVDK